MLSNNIANLNTPAFKKARTQFVDVVHQAYQSDQTARVASSVGLGTTVSGVQIDTAQGDLRQTDRPLDVTIQGAGFIEVQLREGETGYTRLGALRVGSEGDLQTTEGLLLTAAIVVPTDATSLRISDLGEVTVATGNSKDPQVLGTIEIARFINPEGLEAAGNGIFRKTAVSGEAYFSVPGEDGAGTLKQGFLESSNVDLVDELTELLLAQRAYQLNARVIQAADEILTEVANLRR